MCGKSPLALCKGTGEVVGRGTDAGEKTSSSVAAQLVAGGAVRWLARYTRLIVTLASLAESVQPDKSTAVLQVPGSDP